MLLNKSSEWGESRRWRCHGLVEMAAKAGTVQLHGLLWPLISATLVLSLLSMCVRLAPRGSNSLLSCSQDMHFHFPTIVHSSHFFFSYLMCRWKMSLFFWSTWICYLLFIFLVPATVLDAFCACRLLHSLDLPSLRTENIQCWWLCLPFSQTWSIAFLVHKWNACAWIIHIPSE